ncbi:gamma-butyrobetaine hydroxylase-like domain-containing protein [Jiella sp. M17.18]|uniref:gamma-butyrobetaine hydroxylase-like domain-containing protein n=1 Tax=Jiella sp. M17.18 TaxID=3234247 RepID=UPI0034DE24FE
MSQSVSAPEELRVSPDRRMLVVVFPGGARDEFSAEFLRVLSPSAEVQGHAPEQRKTVGGKKDVTIANVLPIGHYAVRIVFSDGHDSGIYTWSYLAELGREKDQRWQGYLAELQAKGLKRER